MPRPRAPAGSTRFVIIIDPRSMEPESTLPSFRDVCDFSII
jgi:hypothetical protein